MSTATKKMRRVLAVTLLALAPIVLVGCWLAVRADLGDRLATHFKLSGHPDGFTDTIAFVVGMTVASAILATLGVAAVTLVRHGSARPYVAMVGFAAWALSASGCAVLLAGRDVAPAAARSGWAPSLAAVLAGVVVAGAAYLLTPATGRVGGTVAARPSEPAYLLAPGERATWIGGARSRPLAVGAVVVVLVAVVLFFIWGAFPGLVALLVALVLAWTHSLTMRVDATGITVHFGPLAWPARHIDLADIETIEATTIQPLKWGGWGYRITPRGTGIVVRGGPGVVVGRRGGGAVAVTVDAPQDAADLVHALQQSMPV